MIGTVVQVNDAAGGVEVGKSALIGAVKRGGTRLDNESLLGWLKGSRLGGRIFGGVGIGTVDHAVWLDTTGAVRTTSAEGSSGKGLCRDAQKTSQAMARE